MREVPRKTALKLPLLALAPVPSPSLQPHWSPCCCHTSMLPATSGLLQWLFLLPGTFSMLLFIPSLTPFRSVLKHHSNQRPSLRSLGRSNFFPLPISIRFTGRTFLQRHPLSPGVCLFAVTSPTSMQHHQSFTRWHPQRRARADKRMFAGSINE